MSVINQVLNQLERRGAPAVPEQDMVCAVPRAKRKSAVPLLAVVMVLVTAVAAWQWAQMRKPKAVAAPAARQQPSPVPVSAVPPPVVAESRITPQEKPKPASRLSFELSSTPLPSTPREPRAGQSKGENADAARVAERQPVAPPEVRGTVKPENDVSSMKQISPAQRAEAEFREAVASMQRGHISDAISGYEAVLRLDAGHDAARQALVALLLENKRGADAERVLQDGLRDKPGHTGFAMLLARLQVERGAVEPAVATLEKSLQYANARADYQAFLAALLQRQNRHEEAITYYQIALRLAPNNGVWLVGYGISLQAMRHADEAREMFRRALETGALNAELQAFARQKLKD